MSSKAKNGNRIERTGDLISENARVTRSKAVVRSPDPPPKPPEKKEKTISVNVEINTPATPMMRVPDEMFALGGFADLERRVLQGVAGRLSEAVLGVPRWMSPDTSDSADAFAYSVSTPTGRPGRTAVEELARRNAQREQARASQRLLTQGLGERLAELLTSLARRTSAARVQFGEGRMHADPYEPASLPAPTLRASAIPSVSFRRGLSIQVEGSNPSDMIGGVVAQMFLQGALDTETLVRDLSQRGLEASDLLEAEVLVFGTGVFLLVFHRDRRCDGPQVTILRAYDGAVEGMSADRLTMAHRFFRPSSPRTSSFMNWRR